MVEHQQFTISVEQIDGFEFKVRWDWETASSLVIDEPSPLGRQAGPNGSRLVAAAVGNCLSSSLAFCLQRTRVEVRGLKTKVTGSITRNERGRLRISGLAVSIELPLEVEQAKSGLERCLGIFEDYCIVTESVRHGIPVTVEVVGASGAVLKHAE
jgi:uncharacterized OsmC-like protein